MANTEKLKKQVETWFAEELRQEFPTIVISKEKIKLTWGGEFEHDIVMRRKIDNKIEAVYCLSCSEYKTSNGKGGSGKLHKIRADALMMVGTESPKKILAFTGKTMYEKVENEQKNGRMPKDIILEYIDLEKRNSLLFELVKKIRTDASNEVNPNIK